MKMLPQVQGTMIIVSYSADIEQYKYGHWKKYQHYRDRFGIKPWELNKIKLREISILPEWKKFRSVEDISTLNTSIKETNKHKQVSHQTSS